MFGPLPHRKLPVQDTAKLLLLADRYNRAASAHGRWATPAKLAIDFVEGRQWSSSEITALQNQGRFAMRFNFINSIIRTLVGHFSNNKTDINIDPAYDGGGAPMTAEALTRLIKQIANQTGLEYVDVEVFMDGIITGRGIYDSRLHFTDNVYGEYKIRCEDNFATLIDPDATSYDPNGNGGWNYTITRRWTNPDEVEWAYGKQVAELIRPLARGSIPMGPIIDGYGNNAEITPVRAFGNDAMEGTVDYWNKFQSLMGDYVDPLRKNIQALDFQYMVTTRRNCFVDLESGEKKEVPEDFDQATIEKAMAVAASLGNPMDCVLLPVRKVRWTTIIGDLFVYDDWSPYDRFTQTGYFPWFRRGVTLGMVDDLIDPQREINKRRSTEIEIVTKTSNSGWKYHKDAMDATQKARLKRFGAMPGVNIEHQAKEEWQAPQKIDPSPPPTAMDRLEQKGIENIRQISGVNESALGELDRVQSGRAIEARQRSAVIGAQMYFDNFSRTKKLLGEALVAGIQRFYTVERTFRVLGEDGKFMQLVINQQAMDPANGLLTRLNDVTVGKYTVTVDEQPFSPTFQSAQYEEALSLIEKVAAVNPGAAATLTDLLVDLSSLPRKDEWVSRIQQAMGLAPADPNSGTAGMVAAPGAPGAPPGAIAGPGGPVPPQPGSAGNMVQQLGAPPGQYHGEASGPQRAAHGAGTPTIAAE